MARAAPAEPAQAPPAVDYEALVRELVDMHELEERIGKKGADVRYEDVRRLRRDLGALWDRARVAIYGEPEVDNKPKSKAEAERWERNAKRVNTRKDVTQE